MDTSVTIQILRNFRKIDTECSICENQSECPELDSIRRIEMTNASGGRWLKVGCEKFRDRRKIERQTKEEICL